MDYIDEKLALCEVPEEQREGNHEIFADHGCNGIVIQFAEYDGTHYGEYVCSDCGDRYAWVSKPENEGRRTETSSFSKGRIARKKSFTEPFCFICGRTEEKLHDFETIERDHIVPLAKGGKDVIGNLRLLCTSCHHHLKPFTRMISGIKPDNAY